MKFKYLIVVFIFFSLVLEAQVQTDKISQSSFEKTEAGTCTTCNILKAIANPLETLDKVLCDPLKDKQSALYCDFNRCFKLTKENENKFKAEVNFNFKSFIRMFPSLFTKLFMSEDEIAQKIEKHEVGLKQYVKACLKAVTPVLKNSNGKTIEISLTEDANVPQMDITVMHSSHRSNWLEYNEEISCETIVHETLHMLGLQDEYKEKSSGYITDPITGEKIFIKENAEVLAYDCRCIGPDDSIMSHESLAFEAVFWHTYIDSIVCRCKSEKCDLKNAVRQRGDTCPKNFAYAGMNKGPYVDVSGMTTESMDNYLMQAKIPPEINSKDQIITYREVLALQRPTKETVLEDSHFNMITNPTCYKANKEYLKCYENAYRTSIIEGCL